MPTAAHIFAGLIVGSLLYHVSQKKFTPYHIIIFAMQSVIGPDLGWPFAKLSVSVALFIHSAFGFAVCAFVLAIPFCYIGRALKVPIRYSDVYKLTAAGGVCHAVIDGLGHLASPHEVEPFGLFSFDVVEYFLHTSTGNYILGGAIAIFILGIVLCYHHYARESAGKRLIATKDTIGAMSPFPVIVGALLLLRLMPFGNIYGFSIADAVYYTGAWSGVGVTEYAYWIYYAAFPVVVAVLLAYKKAPRLVKPIGIGFATVLFLVYLIVPDAGGGEADLGLTYFILLFIALPALLLGTCYRNTKNVEIMQEKKEREEPKPIENIRT